MTPEWEDLCRADDLTVSGASVEVPFADGRHHRVRVDACGDDYQLSAFVVRQAVVNQLADLPSRIWFRNASTPLVGFRVDCHGRLVGEARVPKAGLSAAEFQLYLRNLAVECDRFEYVLTGRDVE
jgi:hypothetical protein